MKVMTVLQRIICAFCCLFTVISFGQENVLTEKFTLPEEVKETSGLIFFNDRLITHNDSGDGPNLYEIDTISGNLVRTINITNATNVDWEDIAQDDTYIYIADIGNNSGDRQDLKVYRIAKADYLSSTSIAAQVISFSYEDQTDFTPQPNNTNFDAEAMGIHNNNIVIFSKNWVDLQTNAYVIPKTIGSHTAQKVSTFNSQGLITGADFAGDRIMLSGYDTTATPFLIFVHENRPPGVDFFGGNPYRIEMTGTAFLEQGSQVEAIGYFEFDFKCYVTREFSSTDIGGTIFEFPQKLYEFTSDLFSLLSVNDDRLSKVIDIAPNPIESSFQVLQKTNPLEVKSIEMYDLRGKKIISFENTISADISTFSQGVYLAKIEFTTGQIVVKKVIKK